MSEETNNSVVRHSERLIEARAETRSKSTEILSGSKFGESDVAEFNYDPALRRTASCRSRITYVNPEMGVLTYRGYSIEELIEHCSFLETAYLLIYGELPTPIGLATWTARIMKESAISDVTKRVISGFQHEGAEMLALVSSIGTLSVNSNCRGDINLGVGRNDYMYQLLGRLPTLVAHIYRLSISSKPTAPNLEFGYIDNFLKMMFGSEQSQTSSVTCASKVLEKLLIVHADHEQNCSTHVLRCAASSGTDPFLAVASATAALSGTLHGRASEKVIEFLEEVHDARNVATVIRKLKDYGRVPPGFGHAVYRSYDPRARIILNLVEQLHVTGEHRRLLDVALEIERACENEDYFISKRLCPTLELYTGIVYLSLNIPQSMFCLLFSIARVSGWIAHLREFSRDPNREMIRPRQIYDGPKIRTIVPKTG